MLKNLVILVLCLVIVALNLRQNPTSENSWVLQPKHKNSYLLLEKNKNSSLNRVVNYEGNSIRLGNYLFHYESVNKNSVLVPEKEGKWLIFDSLNRLQEIHWYQNDRLFCKQYYVSEKGVSNLDTFYEDSFKIKSLSRPKVEFQTDINDSSFLNIEVYQPEYPNYQLTFGCNCLLRNKKVIRMKNKVLLRAKKKKNGEDILFHVGYQIWNTNFERKDTFRLVY